ncbi:macoilin [Anticarsia gemmatalis]|uniref:macoilin n=1 Tax=Anticarsia gemmatalis TaxID=129554 RepID=UPI003F76686D
MKRRNAETGKMRRPLKRTKITEGMYGNSMLYLKFVMVWATVVMADYMLEFRFEFLWPFWMMLRSVYDSFKYQGLAFSVFFICIALTSDMICFFFIPLQYIFFAASTYVWVQYVWYTFADKGICVPTVAICCLLVYVEGLWRGSRGGGELCRPLAAHCVGYPVVTLGFGAKALIAHRLRQRRQRHVRAMNEFYFQLMRDALPETALDQTQSQQPPTKEASTVANGGTETGAGGAAGVGGAAAGEARQLNGSLRRRYFKAAEHNGHCVPERAHKHALSNGAACPPHDDDDKHDHSKGGAKNSKLEKKEASILKEEKRKNKNKDKDKENIDSHKNTEHTKEHIVKEVESTKECIKSKDCNSNKDKEKEKERDRERETREKEKEREREREREQRECSEELRRVRAELAAALRGEAEARRALAAAAAAERQRRADHHQLKQAHAALTQRLAAWRSGERAALERRLGEERRARTQAEQQLRTARHHARPPSGECESESCRARRAAAEAERAALRHELGLARERLAALQRERGGERAPDERPWHALQERAAHLERALSAETRVKLDLLSALGDAKRNMHIQESLISRQEKEIEELKAQMLAVMPTEFVTPVSGGVSKLRLSDGSPLDPNASVYTPKQLAQCSDA